MSYSHSSYTSGIGAARVSPNRAAGVASAPKMDYNKFLADLKAQQDASNSAGLEQYQNLMGTVDKTRGAVGGLYDAQMSNLQSLGATAGTRIEENRVRGLGQAEQGRMNRGLTNTTIASSEDRGINLDAERSRQENNESVNTAKAGVLANRAGAEMNLGQFEADSILSKRNVAPDLAMYLQMIQQMGASGGFRY